MVKSFIIGSDAQRFCLNITIGLIAILPLLFGMANAQSTQSPKSEAIALSLPMSGRYEMLGKQFLTGAKLALETMDEQSRPKIKVVDDGCNEEKAMTAAQEIAASFVRLAMGYLCNDSARVSADIVSRTGIPMLVYGARASRLTLDRNTKGWKLFRASPPDNAAASRAFEVFSKRWKELPFALVDDGSLTARAMIDEFRARMEEAGLKATLVKTYRQDMENQDRLVQKIISSGAGAVLIAGKAADFYTIAKGLLARSEDMEIAAMGNLDFLGLLDSEHELNGTLFAIMRKPESYSVGVKELNAKLSKLQIEPTPIIYDGFAAMQIALQALGKNAQETFNNLAKMEFSTLYGPVKFDPQGANIHTPYKLYRYEDGNFISIANN